jgi:hypothetical protein
MEKSCRRVTLHMLGSGTNAVQTQYTYSPWNTSVQGGKLQQIYTTRGAQVLQHFQYPIYMPSVDYVAAGREYRVRLFIRNKLNL